MADPPLPPTDRPATATDVAARAGVSQSTVSLVVSGKAEGRVSPATAERVRQAAADLGYRPNASGRLLRTGRPSLLGVVVPNAANPFFGALLAAADAAARAADHDAMLIDTATNPDWPARLAALLGSRQIAGAVVYTPSPADLAALGHARDRLVLAEADDPGGDVDIDIPGAFERAVAHLRALGHTRVGHFAADYANVTFRRRRGAFDRAVRAAKLPFETPWRASATFDVEDATARARALLDAAPVTALVCDDDLLAAAALRAAADLGRRVPDDLSVVGFGDLDLARLVRPELTTVRLPADELGRLAVEILLGRLRAEAARPTATLRLDLVVRASTGPAPA